MGEGGGFNNNEGGPKRDSVTQKLLEGGITYFCERTGRIFREDIKICKVNIRKNFRAEKRKNNFMIYIYIQFMLDSNLLKGESTFDIFLFNDNIL